MDKCLLYCFLWICSVFASNIEILVPDSLDYGKTCECGRDLTLPCKFKNKTFAIAWMNLHDISPIAQCILNRCDINPKYIDQYKISYDETNHIFNLTIIKLTMKDNGRKLVCSDGTSTDSQLITVKDYEPLLFENTTTGTIQAISGCISNVTKVSFKWIEICGRNKREKEITPKIHNTTTTSCLNNSDCGNDQQMQYSEVISAKASENGKCYLKIVADYGNEHKESYHTVERYMTEDSDEERSNIVIVVTLVDFALILAAVVYLIYFHHKEKLTDQLKKETLTERNEEEKMLANNEANDMSVNKPTVNDHSLGPTVPEIEGEKDLLSSNRDELEHENDLNDEIHKSSEENDLSPIKSTVNTSNLGQAVTEIKEEKYLSCKDHIIINLHPDRDEIENDEKQKDTLVQQNDLDDEIHKNDDENDLSANKSTVNTHCLGQALPDIEEATDLSSKDHIIIDLHPDRNELENDEKQKGTLVQQNDLDDEIHKNDEENDVSDNNSTVHAHCLGQAVPEIEEEKDISSKEQTIIDINTDRDELGNDEKQTYLLAKQHDLDEDLIENEEYHSTEEYDSMDLVNPCPQK